MSGIQRARSLAVAVSILVGLASCQQSDDGDSVAVEDGPCTEVGLEEAISSGKLEAGFFGTGEQGEDSVGVRLIASGSAGSRLCPILESPIVLLPGDAILSPSGKQLGKVDPTEFQSMVVTGPLRPIEPPLGGGRRDDEDAEFQPSAEYWVDWQVISQASPSVGAAAGAESFFIVTGYGLDGLLLPPDPGVAMKRGDAEGEFSGVEAVLAAQADYSPDAIQEAIWAVRAKPGESSPCDELKLPETDELLKQLALDAERYPGIRACLESEAG